MRPVLSSIILGLILGGAPRATAADETKPRLDPSAAPDVQDLVFLGKARPVMIRLHLTIDGRPYSGGWDTYLKKVFKFADYNADGFLDKDEIKRLPTWVTMQQTVRGGYGFNNGPPHAVAQIDGNNDDKVDLAEVRAYYAKQAKVSSLQIVPGNPYAYGGLPGGNQLTTALMKHLGAKDGKLEFTNLTAAKADELVTRLDSGDDETLDIMELTAGMTQVGQPFGGQPGVGGVMPLQPGGPVTIGESAFLLIPREKAFEKLSDRLNTSDELIKRYDKDQSKKLTREEIGLDADTFKLLDRDEDGVLNNIELLRYFIVAPDLEIDAFLGKRDAGKPALQLTPKSKSNLASHVTQGSLETLLLSLRTVQMGLMTSPVQNYVARNAPQRMQYFTRFFEMADRGKKGFVDMKEDVKAPNVQYMKGLFELCDRDGNDKVTRKEFDDALELQSQAFGTTLTLTVNETSRGLFELLDTNRDNRLSIREMRLAKEKLKEYDLNGDGVLNEAEIPVQVNLVIGTGSQPYYGGRQPYNPNVQPRPGATAGPLWFRKMDRNGDGDVSRREFLGSPDAFKKLDLDKDGFLSREEAEKIDAELRSKQTRKN